MNLFTHSCGIDEEPLQCYRAGGYHPIILGDIFKDGRYKVLHKLGWGGYSTVWAAKDLKKQEYVALKVSVSKIHDKSRELKVLRALTNLNSKETGSSHVIKLLDHFQIVGPNGRHQCLVLEFLGPNVTDVRRSYFDDEKLPPEFAKDIAQQALTGLKYLHEHNIVHGDLHVRNIAFEIPSLQTLTEAELLEGLESPITGPVTRIDGKPLGPDVPEYLIRPAFYPLDQPLLNQRIKIVDFGESFFHSNAPDSLNTPLCVRAPEIIFEQKLDHRVDLWSMGCMIYELIVGQPPFDGMSLTPVILVNEMLETTSDELPERWQQKWRTMDGTWTGEKIKKTFYERLEKMYFYGRREKYLTKEDIFKFGALVQRQLRFEPSTRPSVQEILQDPWFKDN